MVNDATLTDRKAADDRQRYLASLQQSEWFSEQDLARYQRRLLERVVRHAHAETDYYRDALKVLFRPDGSLDWQCWPDVPILTRSDVQAAPESLFARSVPEPVGESTEIRTSGSTGRPIRILWDQLAGFSAHMLDARFYGWHGVEIGRSLAVIKSYLDGANLFPEGGKSQGWHAMAPNADVFELNTAATINQQIEWVERRRPDYLMSYPSNMQQIARTMGAVRAKALGLRGCLSFGETVSEDMRSDLTSLFAAPLFDRYGSTEVGQVSAQCPVSTRQHVSMENVHLEILDDAGYPARPGEAGRVIVSGLYNYSMPFVRYDLGDYAILSPDPCPCGRKLISIERIVGRARSVFRFNDGSSKFPYIKIRDIMQILPHKQMQVAQTHLDRVEFRYVPEKTDQTIDLNRLTGIFREHLHESLTIDLKAMPDIARAPSGKFFEYISELE